MASNNYSNADYWDNRYKDEEDTPFDWLFSYDDVKDVIEYLIPDKTSKTLLVGCGNAPFSPDMYFTGGYSQLVNIDLSSVVIKQQAEKFPEQIWKVMNALNMDFPDNTFPAIIDKSLIDTLLCASHSRERTASLVKECHRVLKPGGRFITFSLHTIEEVESTYRDAGLDWKVSCFRIKSDRWNSTTNRKRSRAHTMIVCDKACSDGTYLHEHPLQIPTGTLSEEEDQRLKAEADEVNLKYAMRTVPQNFLMCALYHALGGESAIRNQRMRILDETYNRAGKTVEELEDLSMTPVVDEAELMQWSNFTLTGCAEVAEVTLKKAIADVQKLVDGTPAVQAARTGSHADAQ